MKKYLSLVKFSHTIFALPFAVVGLFLGIRATDANVTEPVWLGVKVLLCMIFARSAAMAFNRWADRKIDAANPRTATRELPSGVMSSRHVLVFVVVNALLFMGTTYFINPLCFALSPVALLVVLGYSYTKRFTALSHFVLGLGLSLAPIGAYLAVTGSFDWLPICYGLVVFFWVAGFDIIYALPDEGYDARTGLRSIPSLLGAEQALLVSRISHLVAASSLIFASYLLSITHTEMNLWQWVASVLFIGILFYQQTLVRPGRLEKVNLAFFTSNGIASVLFGVIFLLDYWL